MAESSSSLGFLATVGMVIGPPFVYADQAYSIARRRNSEGFSKDVCAVLLIANIARIFWWFQVHFEFALLLQSVFMIAAQIGLLSLILRFQPGSFASSAYTSSSEDYRYNDPGPASRRAATPSRRPQITVEPPTPTQQETTLASTGSAPAAVQQQHSAEYSNPAFKALFGSFGGTSSRGTYAPVIGDIRFPTMPTLDTSIDDDEADVSQEDTEPVSLLTRLARQAKRSTLRLGRQLKVLIGVRNDGSLRQDGSSSSRPFGFWTWRYLPSYLLFLFSFSILLLLLHFLLNGSSTYAFILGLFALGLESGLPVPQFITNQQRRSLAGFRLSVLGGWLFGDAFKTVYFLVNSQPIQFICGGVFALCVDAGIAVQAYQFREKTQQEEEEERLAAEGRAAEEAARAGREIPSGSQNQRSLSSNHQPSSRAGQPTKGAAAAASASSIWDSEHADLDDDPVVFDASGHGGLNSAAKQQMFTIEADED